MYLLDPSSDVAGDRGSSTDDTNGLPAPTAVPARDRLVAAPVQPFTGVIVIRLRGELDLLAAARSRRVLLKALDAVVSKRARPRGRDTPELGRAACDLGGPDVASVSGLDVLVDEAERARRRGVTFAPAGVRRPLRRVLDITGITPRSVIADSEYSPAVSGGAMTGVAS